MTTPSIAAARSQGVEAGRLLLSALAAVLYALGWTAVKVLRGIGVAVVATLFAVGWLASKVGPWCAAAVREGWDAGRKGS